MECCSRSRRHGRRRYGNPAPDEQECVAKTEQSHAGSYEDEGMRVSEELWGTELPLPPPPFTAVFMLRISWVRYLTRDANSIQTPCTSCTHHITILNNALPIPLINRLGLCVGTRCLLRMIMVQVQNYR